MWVSKGSETHNSVSGLALDGDRGQGEAHGQRRTGSCTPNRPRERTSSTKDTAYTSRRVPDRVVDYNEWRIGDEDRHEAARSLFEVVSDVPDG